MRDNALERHASTYAAAPAPRTVALPRWLTSKTPTAVRTASCSRRTPPPGYSIGISQPPKSAILAPKPRWRSSSGECFSVEGESATARDGNAPAPSRSGEQRLADYDHRGTFPDVDG